MNPIDTFLFDIGNVLVTFDFNIAARAYQKSSTTEYDPIDILIPLRDRLEVGEMTAEEFVAEGIERIGFQDGPERFVEIYQAIFSPVRPIWDLVERLKGDYRLLLLSNTSDIHHEGLLRDFPIFKAFDGGIFSYLAESAKPDRAIYEQALDELSIVPESTIYLDDLLPNIEVGKSFGFRAHCYRSDDHELCEKFLRESGVAGIS